MNIVIDASGAILGRLASYAAKQALLGKSIVIVNCKEAVLSGDRRMVIGEYQTQRRKGGYIQKGPFLHRSPEKIVKRTIRGMLPHFQKRGLDALKRVMCYNDVPHDYASAKKIHLKNKEYVGAREIKLSELVKEI